MSIGGPFSALSAFFGRLRPTPSAWDEIRGSVREAPALALVGFEPDESPPIWRFRNPRYRGQLIGCCGGESIAAMCETTARTPPGWTVINDAKPVDPYPNYSPLWIYWVGRKYSEDHGRSLRGQEGSILSDNLSAVVESGLISYDAWPATVENYRRYDDNRPPSNVSREPTVRPAGEARLLTSPDLVLQYLGAGYSVVVGMDWRGGMTVGPNGWCSWDQRPIGGHAFELLGYSKTQNYMVIGNSWDNAGWGAQPADPRRPRGWAMCPLDQFMRAMTADAMRSGMVEALVITEVGSDDVPKPVPDPPPPPPPPPPPTPRPTVVVTVTIGGVVYSGPVPRI